MAVMQWLHRDAAHESLGAADLWEALWTSPTAVLLILFMVVIFGGMVRFAHDAPGTTRFLLGAGHSALQLASTGALMIGASRLSSSLGLQGLSSVAAFLVFVAVLGGLGGALGFAAYL